MKNTFKKITALFLLTLVLATASSTVTWADEPEVTIENNENEENSSTEETKENGEYEIMPLDNDEFGEILVP